MTTPSVKEEIDQVIAKLRSKVPNFKDRPSQKIMIAEVAKTFWMAQLPEDGKAYQCQNIIAIEAGTGTGKSQSYLLPSILVARRKKKKVVISSATVKLQQQLCEFELPRLNDCIEGGITYMIAKGRSRYVCPLKLEKEAGGASQMSLMSESNGGKADARDAQIISFHDKWNKQTWDGERDSIKAEDAVWSDISTDANGCLGNRCSKVKQCPFYLARAKLDKADVVVTNHDLLLSDLRLGGGKILTEPSETYYVIDEAHHLPEKTLSVFASHYAAHNTLRVYEKISTDHAKDAEGSLGRQIHSSADVVYDYLNDLTVGLEQIATIKQKGDVLRFPFGVLPESFKSVGDNILTANEGLLEKLSEYKSIIEESMKDAETNAKQEKELMETSMFIDRVAAVSDTWRLMCHQVKEGSPPHAKWIEVIQSGAMDIDFLISVSPVSAGFVLKNALWDKALGVVLTSATLTALSRFDLFSYQAGLALVSERTKFITLPSPFDYPNQGTLVLPKMTSSPKDVVGHTAEVIKILPTIYPSRGGMLVLFASRKQMTEVRDALPDSCKQLTLMQGDVSLTAMLDNHRLRVKDGHVSVIYGLASCAEGLDLPGDLCLRVVIVKLPFDVPSDPIGKTYSEWLEVNGRNPFNEVSLPAASRKLSQWTGRLIRAESDLGEIYCLDSRLTDSKYGAKLIKALPPYRIEKGAVLA